jgi:hypothetical protein
MIMSVECFEALRNSLPSEVDDQFIQDYLDLCEIVEIGKNETFYVY